MRKPRQLCEGARYHVTARINRKEMILARASVRVLFLSTIVRAKRKYRFQIWNFCIMGNHIHFLIEPREGENLSAIMRWILGVFAMSYNHKCRITGHVWGERFHSRILDGLREFVLSFTYIDENPVKAGLAAHVHEWHHGGLYHARAGCRDILGVTPQWLRLLFPDHAVLAIAPFQTHSSIEGTATFIIPRPCRTGHCTISNAFFD
jgi:REP element-mobilizing transposase RayT